MRLTSSRNWILVIQDRRESSLYVVYDVYDIDENDKLKRCEFTIYGSIDGFK